MTGPGEIVLSPAGALRRHAMQVQLAGRVVRRRQRRQVVRTAVAGAVLLALLYAVVPWPAPQPGAVTPVANATVIVGNDPQILQRCTATATVSKDVFVGDVELRELLRSAGQDVGIVRSGGRVLVPGLMADDWQGEPTR